MKKRTINVFVLGAILTLVLFGCSSGNVSDTTATGAAIDGAALYTSDCSGCHGPVAASGKKGASVSQIRNAIANNWGGMGAFAGLSTDQLQAIATALAPVTNTTPATTASLDGAALYADNCSSCHGPLATSGKGGALASAIQAAIAYNSGGMGRLSNLTTAQLQAIADVLATVQTSTPGPAPATADGAALYAQYCGSCHGALATSTKLGATESRIQSGISGNYGGMGSLSNLTSAQVQAIASALAATTPAPVPTDGATLYATYCSSCHGALASSGVRGSSAATIQSAISGVSQMRSISLTTTQIQAIAAAMATSTPTPTPTPAPTDGAALYTTYCSSCHGSLAASSKTGRTAAQIQTAITNNAGGMGSLSNLTTTQVQSIATALGTAPAPAPTPTPTACGSCHAIPPATGHHTYHVTSQRVSCGTCHGTGYSSTTVNTATHNNGVVNISSTPGWNPSTRTCSNSCHSTESW